MTMHFTKHGLARICQRGFRQADPDLIRRCGTQIDDPDTEVYFVRDKDVEDYQRELKRQLQESERLRGCKVVLAGNNLVTIVRAGRRHTKKMLRHRS